MRPEHRKAQRRRVSQPVMMADDSGATIGPCTILDVSAGGARLKFSSDAPVPAEFVLLLSTFDASVRRRCALAWRTAEEIGVRFLGT